MADHTCPIWIGHILANPLRKLLEKSHSFKLILTGKNVKALASQKKIYWKKADAARLYYLENESTLKKHIFFLGHVSYEKVESCYTNCDYVVLPSLYEGYGLPLIEALAHGILVICSDISPFKEQVSMYKCDDMVQFFSSNNFDALVDCMEQALLRSQYQFDTKIIQKRLRVWTWEDVAKNYVNNLKSLTKKYIRNYYF